MIDGYLINAQRPQITVLVGEIQPITTTSMMLGAGASITVNSEVELKDAITIVADGATPTPKPSTGGGNGGGSSAVTTPTPTPSVVPVKEFKGTQVKSTKTIFVGNTSILNESLSNYKGIKVTYKSSDDSLVKVYEDGKIVGLKQGIATIN